MPQHTDARDSDPLEPTTEVTRVATVSASVGLHARPAARFTRAVAELAPLHVTITDADGRSADAASILSVLALGIPNGAVVTLSSTDRGAVAALDGLVSLLETGLDD